MQNKGINLLWLGYSLLLAIVIVVSMQDCVRFVPTYYEGLAAQETSDGTKYYSLNGELISLPEPSFSHLDKKLAIPCALCCLLLYFKKRILSVFACVLAMVQVLIVACSGKLYDLISKAISSQMCAIGKLHGYHELTHVGIIELLLCIIIFLATVFLTSVYFKEAIERKGD